LTFEPVLEVARAQIAAGLRPAIQLAVDWRGELVLDAAVGEGVSTDDCFVLWSSTKPFIAVALLQIMHQRGIDLDEPVARFLPEFGKHGKRAVTLAHLLTHRGGFPANDPRLRRELFVLLRDWDRALEFVCELELAWEPGTQRGYHPFSSWFVVGELVQRLDGRPLADTLRARVLEPAGIERDGFTLGRPEELGSAPVVVRTNGEKGAPPQAEARYWSDPDTHRAVIPGGGGIARAREVVKLYRALLRGGRGPNGQVLEASWVRMATFPHVVGSIDRTFLRDIPWGLGFHLKHVRPSLDDCGTSATPGTFGHAGHFMVNTAWGDPGKDLAVCLLSNGLCAPRPGTRAVHDLSEAVHRLVDAGRAGLPSTARPLSETL
jgi:CubicO group peptidase (beta-lactamase class C family)